jgi:hypothetical protein
MSEECEKATAVLLQVLGLPLTVSDPVATLLHAAPDYAWVQFDQAHAVGSANDSADELTMLPPMLLVPSASYLYAHAS